MNEKNGKNIKKNNKIKNKEYSIDKDRIYDLRLIDFGISGKQLLSLRLLIDSSSFPRTPKFSPSEIQKKRNEQTRKEYEIFAISIR
jgi:hypothetical protein